MAKRDSGKTGAAIDWVRTFRRDRGSFPTAADIRASLDVTNAACYEAIRRVRAEFNEPTPTQVHAPEVRYKKALDFTFAYHKEHNVMPTASGIAFATNVSLSTARNALFDARSALGLRSRGTSRRAVGTQAQNDRQAEIMATYNDFMDKYPNMSVNGAMVATAAVLGISRQRVHQVLIFEGTPKADKLAAKRAMESASRTD